MSDNFPYVNRVREKGKLEFKCLCGGTVSLAEPKARIHFRSKEEALEQSADGQRGRPKGTAEYVNGAAPFRFSRGWRSSRLPSSPPVGLPVKRLSES